MSYPMYCPTCQGRVEAVQGPVMVMRYAPYYGIAWAVHWFLICTNCALVTMIDPDHGGRCIDLGRITVTQLADPVVPGLDDEQPVPFVSAQQPSLLRGRKES